MRIEHKTFGKYYERTESYWYCKNITSHDACNMYPFVSGEFTPVESYTSGSSLGETELAEAGMGLKSESFL